MSLSEIKKNLRKNILKQRSALSPIEISQKSQAIAKYVSFHPDYEKAKTILIYLDFKSEVQTELMVKHALLAGKKVYVPVVQEGDDNLLLVAYEGDITPMYRSNYGILEPLVTTANTISIGAIDLILAPGVAFDARGYRLGYGGGYYDRLIEPKKDLKLPVYALAFSLQMVEHVPHDTWDQRIDGIFTESGFIPTAP